MLLGVSTLLRLVPGCGGWLRMPAVYSVHTQTTSAFALWWVLISPHQSFIWGLELGLANSSSWAISNSPSVFIQVLLEYSHVHLCIVNKFVYELFMAASAVELTGKLTKTVQPWSFKYLLFGWPLTKEVLALTQNRPCIHSFISRQRRDRPLYSMQGSQTSLFRGGCYPYLLL